jgi:hypothetical protein
MNGLVPMWLKKHVKARGRLVHNLPQERQGSLALWEVLVATTVWVSDDVVVEAVIFVDTEDEAFDCVWEV